MKTKEAVQRLRDIAEKYNGDDEEVGHGKADDVLLDLIDDVEVRRAFDAVDKWYA